MSGNAGESRQYLERLILDGPAAAGRVPGIDTMNAITVREAPGVISLTLAAPLPRNSEEWEPVVSAFHHACLGRSGSHGVVIELQGVRWVTSAEIAGIVRCIVHVMRMTESPCPVRIVSDSDPVRRAFEICSGADLGACEDYDEAIAELG